MVESFWDTPPESFAAAIHRGRTFSPDDLIGTLTRLAALADSAVYGLRRGQGIDVLTRFEQIKEEALEAIECVENGGL